MVEAEAKLLLMGWGDKLIGRFSPCSSGVLLGQLIAHAHRQFEI